MIWLRVEEGRSREGVTRWIGVVPLFVRVLARGFGMKEEGGCGQRRDEAKRERMTSSASRSERRENNEMEER